MSSILLVLVCAIGGTLCAPPAQAPFGYGTPYGSYFQPEEVEAENEFGEGLGPRPNPPIQIPGTAGVGAGPGAGARYPVAYEPPDFEDIYNYQLLNRQAGGQGGAGTQPYGLPPLTQADFTKFDANNDGAIDYNDLFQATRYAEDKEEIFNTFKGSDINFDGRVSRNEFFTFPLEWQRLVLENNYYEQLYSRMYAPPQPPPSPPARTQMSRGPVHGQMQGQKQDLGQYQTQPTGQVPSRDAGTSPSQPDITQGIDVYPTEPVYNDTMMVDGNYTDAPAGNETFFYDYGNTTTYGNDTAGYDGYPTVDIAPGVDQQAGVDTGAGVSPAVETSVAAKTEPGVAAAEASIGETGAQAPLPQPATQKSVATVPQKQPVRQPQRGAVVPQQPAFQPQQRVISQPPRQGGAGAGKPTYPQLQRPVSQQYPQQPPRQPQQQQRQPQQQQQPQRPRQPPPQRPPQPPQQRPPQPPQQPQYNPYQYPYIDPEDYAEYLTYKQMYPNMFGGQAGQQGGQQTGGGGYQPYPGQYSPFNDEEGGISLEQIAKFQTYDSLFGHGQGQGQGQQGPQPGGYYNPYGQQPTYDPYAQAYDPYGQANPNPYPPYFD